MCAIGRYTLFLDARAMRDAAPQPEIASVLFCRPAHRLVTTLTELSLLFLLTILDFV
jgi:hypothetical protein